MLFKKSKPPIPPIENEREFIYWILRYSDDTAILRKPYKNVDKVINLIIREIYNDIEAFDLYSAEALMDRGGDIALGYKEEFEPLVENYGEILRCPTDLQAKVVLLIAKIVIMTYLARHKYGADVPEKFLGMTQFEK